MRKLLNSSRKLEISGMLRQLKTTGDTSCLDLHECKSPSRTSYEPASSLIR
jgi:hypothetical protein